jgi:hypothetical protein
MVQPNRILSQRQNCRSAVTSQTLAIKKTERDCRGEQEVKQDGVAKEYFREGSAAVQPEWLPAVR